MGSQEGSAFQEGFGLLEAMTVLSDVVAQENGGDAEYFSRQRARYLRTLERIRGIRPAPCLVLDIGSHYLHQAVLLSQLGYEVWGIDIELFTGAEFVRNRSRRFNIHNITVKNLEDGDFLANLRERVDVILFTETLEHITFNPIRFWRRVYELLCPEGIIYLTTPNSLRPAAVARTVWNIITLGGIGLSVEQIFANVTYGHHWKEYSAREIKKYFRALSSDFKVETRWYSSDSAEGGGVKSAAKRLLGAVPCLRSDLEAVISLSRKTGVTARWPELPMQARGVRHRG